MTTLHQDKSSNLIYILKKRRREKKPFKELINKPKFLLSWAYQAYTPNQDSQSITSFKRDDEPKEHRTHNNLEKISIYTPNIWGYINLKSKLVNVMVIHGFDNHEYLQTKVNLHP